MKFLKTALLVLAVLLCSVQLALATIPWPYVESIVQNSNVETSLFVLPDGSGPPLTEAQRADGVMVDGTITLVLIDEYGAPIAQFPHEDIWLETECDTQVPCPGGFSPDGPSANDGTVIFSTSQAGGGWTDGLTYVYVNGMRALDPFDLPYNTEHPPLPLHFNSADINGDGIVDLADLGLFATDYFGDYNYRSDFHWDGYLNLNDVGKMAEGYARECQ